MLRQNTKAGWRFKETSSRFRPVELKTYNQKRNFAVTAEPKGRAGHRRGDSFVIQKHAARRLHYDLRLELDGVMKSWAVARGPSLVPGEKRLAVHTEDHPIEYNKFEGNIPKGEYGGGAVLIWDRGRWSPVNDPHKGYAKGHLEFTLAGEKLTGRWHLVRMRKRAGEKQEPWLLIKGEDDAARTQNDPDILEQSPRSVVTGRTITEVAENKKPLARKPKLPPKTDPEPKTAKAKSAAAVAAPDVLRAATPKPTPKPAKPKTPCDDLPDFVPPALATLRASPPGGADWLHEVKFDGYRMQGRLENGTATLRTRKGLDWTARFLPVARAVAALDAASALFDGEIVVEDENGVSDFSALQADLKAGRKSRFLYYVFDLLYLDGEDLRERPLTERRERLSALLSRSGDNGVVRFSEHLDERGSVVLKHACAMGLEGIVSKRRDAPYRSGRIEAWLKAKCGQGQELVIIGYADSTAMPRAIGALLVGYYDGGVLRYAGRTGTGYTEKVAADLWQRLQPLRVETSPVTPIPAEERRRGAVWVAPQLVAEIKFRGWTGTGLIRQSVFIGLREDKPASEVVREDKSAGEGTQERNSAPARGGEKARGKANPKTGSRVTSKRSASPPARPNGSASARGGSGGESRYKERRPGVHAPADVRLTNPDRLYWPDAAITKQQLAEYYASVWERMSPHVAGRPLALVRCPEGVGTPCFFQKHMAAGLTATHVRTVKDAKGEDLLYIDSLDGVIALVQAGVLEIHVWGSTVANIEACDRLIFDLDPGEDVPWPSVVAAARELRERLAALGLESFVKTTGGKGLHVLAPCRGADWERAKSFAHAVVLAMERDAPSRYVSKMTKSIRTGRIFLDYLRNGRGATAVAAYSTRARPGAPISTPVRWDELGPRLAPDKYTLGNIGRRLGGQSADPWAEVAAVHQDLPDLAKPQGRRTR